MEALKEYLEYCLHLAMVSEPQIFMHQAFGSAQYYLFVCPDAQEEVESLWDVYKSQFEELIYGGLEPP